VEDHQGPRKARVYECGWETKLRNKNMKEKYGTKVRIEKRNG